MDSVFKSEFYHQAHTDEVTHQLSQPSEDLILARNAELRKNPGVIKDFGDKGSQSWGRQIASIPMMVFEKAIVDGFDLNCKDKDYAAKEMQRFLATYEGKTCLVQG